MNGENAPILHIGTSGWSYGDWVGPFYPERTRKGEFLTHYAREFQVVEIDSTYYRPPSASMVAGWRERTPDGFLFAPKAPGEITHEKMLLDCEESAERFLGALAELGDRTLCVLLQFPYFNRGKFASAGPFLERLDAFLGRYAERCRFAVEIRNRHWLTSHYFGLLRSHGAVATLVEHSWLPPIDQLASSQDVVTGPFSYVRLIGDRQGIEKITRTWEKQVVDRTADLKRIAVALRRIGERVPVYTFVNNHYAGHGPQTVRQLRAEFDRPD